jgi:hypothetical protein
MTLNGVDNGTPVISVELVPGALQGQRRRQRKSLRQCHAVRLREDRGTCFTGKGVSTVPKTNLHDVRHLIPSTVQRTSKVRFADTALSWCFRLVAPLQFFCLFHSYYTSSL